MKLIIDIDEEEYKEALKDTYSGTSFENKIFTVIANGKPISDNATNGDVIKAMFPNIDFTEMTFTVHATTSVISNGVKGNISYDFWKDWWNAPYKAESEDKE